MNKNVVIFRIANIWKVLETWEIYKSSWKSLDFDRGSTLEWAGALG